MLGFVHCNQNQKLLISTHFDWIKGNLYNYKIQNCTWVMRKSELLCCSLSIPFTQRPNHLCRQHTTYSQWNTMSFRMSPVVSVILLVFMNFTRDNKIIMSKLKVAWKQNYHMQYKAMIWQVMNIAAESVGSVSFIVLSVTVSSLMKNSLKVLKAHSKYTTAIHTMHNKFSVQKTRKPLSQAGQTSTWLSLKKCNGGMCETWNCII